MDGVEETEAAPAKDFMSRLNPNSLTVVKGALAEPVRRRGRTSATVFQFLRTGYFCKDKDSTAELPVYNRTVAAQGQLGQGAEELTHTEKAPFRPDSDPILTPF